MLYMRNLIHKTWNAREKSTRKMLYSINVVCIVFLRFFPSTVKPQNHSSNI